MYFTRTIHQHGSTYIFPFSIKYKLIFFVKNESSIYFEIELVMGLVILRFKLSFFLNCWNAKFICYCVCIVLGESMFSLYDWFSFSSVFRDQLCWQLWKYAYGWTHHHQRLVGFSFAFCFRPVCKKRRNMIIHKHANLRNKTMRVQYDKTQNCVGPEKIL